MFNEFFKIPYFLTLLMNAIDTANVDPELAKVVEFFLRKSGFEAQAAVTLRRALDEVMSLSSRPVGAILFPRRGK